MEKFVPYEKLSKKKQRERNAARRGSWGALNPVTRKPEKSGAYNRRKMQSRRYEPDDASFLFLSQFCLFLQITMKNCGRSPESLAKNVPAYYNTRTAKKRRRDAE